MTDRKKDNMPPELRSRGRKIDCFENKPVSILYFNLYYDKTNITAYDDFHSSDVSNFERNNLYWIQQSNNVYSSFRVS